jgi:hypothetical protein
MRRPRPRGSANEPIPPEKPQPAAPAVIDQDQLRATAYHEAGHAVMAISVGRTVEKATVTPKKNMTGGLRLGTCHMGTGRSKASQSWIDDEVLILLAGMVAEARYTGKYCTRGAAEDLLAIRRLLEHRAGDDRQLERIQKRLLDKAEYVLSDAAHALAIEWVARELVERGTVSGKSVRHFFELAIKRSES